MADWETLQRWKGHSSSLPPLKSDLKLGSGTEEELVAEEVDDCLQPIAAFVCIIDYQGDLRLITCRRFDLIGDNGYVGAICHEAHGYRQFRCDRILSVSDATTGEVLGDGDFFAQFAIDSYREAAPTWGLSSSRRATLVAGLNVLAFMARCDGKWHPLETDVIENFVCSMWLRKEWEGDPPIDQISSHAQRLSPRSDQFFSALKHYAHSTTSTRILKRAIGELIAADGIICAAETHWGNEVESFFDEYSEELYRQHFEGYGL